MPAGGTSAFSHICLSVQDIDTSTRFYTEVLGFKATERYTFSPAPGHLMEIDERVDFSTQFLVLGDVRLELMCFERPEPVSGGERRPMYHCGFTHIAVRVGDLDETTDNVPRYGGRVIESTRTTLPMEGYECKMIYCVDPDGNRIELLWMPEDVHMQV